MRYFVHLGFDGGSYRGWQRQGETRYTVQEVIEDVLSKIFKKKMSSYGCGRTDAGVHASQYVLQIELDDAPSFDLKYRLNKNLPSGIAVFEIIEVEPDQHCRHNATARTYDYFLHWEKNPGLQRFSSFYDGIVLDFDKMKEATELIAKTQDFKSLCKQPDLYQHTFCEIMNCELFVNQEQGRLRFTITANRFLRGMVRYCVFFLLEVGTGNLSLEEFSQVLKQKVDPVEKRPAHPNGLFLSKIEYPFISLSDPHQLIKMLKTGLV